MYLGWMKTRSSSFQSEIRMREGMRPCKFMNDRFPTEQKTTVTKVVALLVLVGEQCRPELARLG